MTPAPKPIPGELRHTVFTAAQAARSGVTESMLRGGRFLRVQRGVYVVKRPAAPAPKYVQDQVLEQAQHYAPKLRAGEAFSHTTALILFGAPIDTAAAVHTTIAWPNAPARNAGVRGHRTRVPFAPVEACARLRCVPPELALLQASTLPFRELVVAVDHLILPQRRRGGRAQIEHGRLTEYLRQATGPGIARVRAACLVARVGAESRYETLTRFELALMGLDELELQVDLHRADGSWYGRFDLVHRLKRKIIEFDGEQHRTDRRQYLRDLQRLEAARVEGYEVLRLHAEDFAPGARERTRRRLCDFLGEQPRPVPPHLRKFFREPY